MTTISVSKLDVKSVVKVFIVRSWLLWLGLSGDFNQTGRCCGEVPNIYSMVFHYSWKMELELPEERGLPKQMFFHRLELSH